MSLNEELVEWTAAVAKGDIVGQVDALIDLMYFATGVLYKLGLSAEQIEQCVSAVHAANMTKRRGTNAKRDTGAADAIKPDGWVAPEQRIATILGVSE
jgi:predicted HAD superfamily Cof-like phosphohydrolase